MTALQYILPEWSAPANVHAATTLRSGGVSRGPYASLNLAMHVGDQAGLVQANRALLQTALELPSAPRWLKQVHGRAVIDAAMRPNDAVADGMYSRESGLVCAVLTADCLPILLCDRQGTTVAALHAGWRGLAHGVIEAGVAAMNIPGEKLLAWLGPAIGRQMFEVGPEVRAAFVQQQAADDAAFLPGRPGHFLADIYELARRRLARLGVTSVTGGGECTVTDSARFFSYRRDGVCGRMASLIWLSQQT